MGGRSTNRAERGFGVFCTPALRGRDVEDACRGTGKPERPEVHGDRDDSGESPRTRRGDRNDEAKKGRTGRRRAETDFRPRKLMHEVIYK